MGYLNFCLRRHPVSKRGQWCRSEKRLGIYIRDCFACVYCGQGVVDRVKLTLDHVVPWSEYGSDDESNLVTACHLCNSTRGKRSVSEFVKVVALRLNDDPEAIKAYIQQQLATPIDRRLAKGILLRRKKLIQLLNKAG